MPATHHRSATRLPTPAALLLVAVSCLGLASCNEGKSASAPKEELRPVLVGTLAYAPDDRSRTLVATIRPRIETDLGFRIAGKVAQRLVDPGQRVKAGGAVAKLDETDLRLQVEQAEAEVAAARVSHAQANADAKRGGDLQRSGWTPQATMDRLSAAAEETRGRLTRGERALELARNGLSYTILRADSDGVVTSTMIEPGQVVAAGQAAVRVARLGEKEAVVALPEGLVARVPQAQARLTLWTQSGRSYVANLREVSPIADPATRTYTARFSLPDADEAVALGMSATVTLTDPGAVKSARVPLTALFDQGTGPALWVVDGQGALSLKPVRVARYDSKDAIIAEGPADGERFVLLGVQKLDPHQRVRTITQLGL